MIKRKLLCFASIFAISLLVCSCDETKPDEPVVPDYDSYVISAGAAGDIPAWTKSDNTYSIPDLKLHGEGSNITPELKAALADAKTKDNFFKKPKNYIVMIGDGMGVSQIVAATKFRGDLLMNELPYRAVANSFVRENNEQTGSIITDSGAGGTKISTGYRTTKLFAAMDAEGNELESLSELARKKGKKVGVVTNAELPDATPADFSVHNKNRSQGWNKICQAEVLFGADLFMGGNNSSLTAALRNLKPLSGETILQSKKLEDAVKNLDKPGLMWNLFSGGDTTYGRWDSVSKTAPSLSQQIALSLTRLQKTSGDNGFFLMFENTYTDIYGHANQKFMNTTKVSSNVVGIVNEVMDFDEAVAIALKFVLENPDTVLLITADHETGNMSFKKGWEDASINDGFVTAKSGSHSNQNVPIFAIGYGLSSIDTKNGAAYVKADCSAEGAGVLDNAVCGQVLGSLMNDQADSFGGDTESDTRGRSRDTYTVTTTNAADSVDFSFSLKYLPLNDTEFVNFPISAAELVQFKIKPYSGASSITIKVDDGTTDYYTEYDEDDSSKCKTGNYENISFADCTTAKIEEASPLAPAHAQAFVSTSPAMDGWYQVSCRIKNDTEYVTVHLDGTAPAGSVIELDDLTVQYASTKGLVCIDGPNVTASTNKIGY